MGQFLKWAIFQKLFSKMVSLGQKLKMPKNMPKTLLQEHWSCSAQKKKIEKNTKYSGKERILKIAYLCKMVSLGQKLKMSKTCQKLFLKNVRVVLFKKPSRKKKTTNIREMRQF